MQYWLLQLALELEERLNKDRDQVGIMLSNQYTVYVYRTETSMEKYFCYLMGFELFNSGLSHKYFAAELTTMILSVISGDK